MHDSNPAAWVLGADTRGPVFALVVAAQVLILLAQVFLWNFRTGPVTLTPGQGLSTYGQTAVMDGEGLHLCAEGQTASGDFATTRWLALRAGQWRFTVTYTADGATSGRMRVYSNLAESNGDVEMPAGGGTVSLDAWLPSSWTIFSCGFRRGRGSDHPQPDRPAGIQHRLCAEPAVHLSGD